MNTATATNPKLATAPVAEMKVINLDKIVLSKTPMQKLRRAHFSPDSMKELTASVLAVGVLQPILVRTTNVPTLFELVAGERRHQAAKTAGLINIPAVIRTLDDLQVIEMQVIENNQRQDLHEMIEAAGYAEMQRPPHNRTAEQIAEHVGRSKRYVHNRLRLMHLCVDAQNAFYANKIGSVVAFQLSRIGHHNTQRAALRDLYRQTQDGEQPGARDAISIISRRYMLHLADAKFSKTDVDLVPKAGACTICPKRTGNQPELFSDIKSQDVCSDIVCFDAKRIAHAAIIKAAGIKAGLTVITGKTAKEMFPYDHSDTPHGAIKPNDKCWQDPKTRTYKQILGADAPPLSLVENPNTKDIIEVWPEQSIKRLLAKKLPAKSFDSNGRSSAKRKQDNKAAEAIEAFLFEKITGKFSGKLDRPTLIEIANMAAEQLPSSGDLVGAKWKLPDGYAARAKIIAAMKDKDLPRFIFHCAIANKISGIGHPWGKNLLAQLCKQHRLDPKKLRTTAAGAATAKKPAAKK